jgi:hypothetical protein
MKGAACGLKNRQLRSNRFRRICSRWPLFNAARFGCVASRATRLAQDYYGRECEADRKPSDGAAVSALQEEIKAVMLDVIPGLLADLAPSSARPALLTTAELAHELRVCSKTVERMVKDGCPHVTVGANCPRYQLDRVLAWLDARAAVKVTEGLT